MLVCIGAMMVGATHITVQEGQEVDRGQEIGFFQFGGSTVLLLVPPTPGLEFDDDILANSRQQIETLVRVSMQIGRRV